MWLAPDPVYSRLLSSTTTGASPLVVPAPSLNVDSNTHRRPVPVAETDPPAALVNVPTACSDTSSPASTAPSFTNEPLMVLPPPAPGRASTVPAFVIVPLRFVALPVPWLVKE